MTVWLLLLITSVIATISAVFAMLAFHRIGRFASGPVHERLHALLRGEVDRILRFGDEQSRGLREELGGTIRGFQDSTLKAFRELGDALANRINEFGIRMDAGVKAIDDRAIAIGHKLDHDIVHMGEDGGRARDVLRHGQTATASLKRLWIAFKCPAQPIQLLIEQGAMN
jgi:hypothetical protein